MTESSNINESDLTAKLFHENEMRTNYLVSLALGLTGIIAVGLAIYIMSANIGLLNYLDSWLLLVAGAINIMIFPIVKHTKFSPIMKWIIITGSLFLSSVTFVFYPLNVNFLCYGPIIISTMYYDSKIVNITAIISWILYTLLLWANVLFENVGVYLKEFHAYQEVTLWKLPQEVGVNYYLPHTCFFFVTTLICNWITKNGKNLVLNKAQMKAQVKTIENDVKAASQIQLSALPAPSFKTEDGRLTINACMRPAKVVGGDFYDYYMFGNNIVALVADVSDKGFSAAMFMMKAKIALRTAINSASTIEEVIIRANKLLCTDNKENMFVTVWLGIIDINTGIGRYINCGHNHPIIKHVDGSLSYVANDPDMILGLFEDIKPRTHVIKLEKGDTLLMFTDGLTDLADKQGKIIERDILKEVVSEMPSDIENACEYVFSGIEKGTEKADQFDDMTLLALRINSNDEVIEDSFTYKASYDSMETAIDAVNALLDKRNCPEEDRRKIDTSLDELLCNIVDYAYEGKEGDFTIDVKVGENYFDAVLRDKGVEFNPLEVEEPDNSELKIGGQGIHLVRNMMDTFEYSRENDENKLHIQRLWIAY